MLSNGGVRKNLILLLFFPMICLMGASFVVSAAAAAPCALRINTAYKLKNSKAVYYVTSSCKKKYFTSSNIFLSYFPSFKSVKTTSADKLSRVPFDKIREMTCYLPVDTAYKVNDNKSNKTIYYVTSDCKRRYFLDTNTLLTYIYSVKDIRGIASKSLSKIPFDKNRVMASKISILVVEPGIVAMPPFGVVNFKAKLNGKFTNNVFWSIEEAGGGYLKAGGQFTASSTPGIYHLNAYTLPLSDRSLKTTLIVYVTTTVNTTTILESISQFSSGVLNGPAAHEIDVPPNPSVPTSTITPNPSPVTGGGGGGGGGGGAAAPTVPAPPIITAFTATPSTIVAGSSTILAWAVSGATQLSIDHGIGIVTGNTTTISPTATHTYVLTATNSGGSTAASVSVTVSQLQNQAPTILIPAGSNPSSITGTTSTLSVLGTDANGEEGLTYTWSVISAPSGASPTFSINGTNASKTTTVTYDRAGNYQFRAIISDGSLSVSSTTAVTVLQTLSNITILPSTTTIDINAVQQFTVTSTDQFGRGMVGSISYSWSVLMGGVGGSVNSSGLYTSPSNSGTDIVRAESGGVNKDAAVTVIAGNGEPSIVSAAASNPSPVTGTTSTLSILGSDDQGEGLLTYTWSVVSKPSGSNVVFSSNGTNAGKNTIATYNQAGNYAFRVVVFDGTYSVSTTLSVTVSQTLSAITVSPNLISLLSEGTRQFTATSSDQFGRSMGGSPVYTWSVEEAPSGGSLNSSGLYTASSVTGTYHIVASSGGKSAISTVNVATVDTGLDLCEGLVQDKIQHPMSVVPKPAAGASYVDPEFGTTIRRISNTAGSNVTVIKPVYSTIQAWNADESYFILYHRGGTGVSGHHLYDGRTYSLIKKLDIRPADLEQIYWDTVDPKILYYADIVTHKLHRFNVDTDTHYASPVIRNFSFEPVNCAYDFFGGSDPMWTSWDSKFFGFSCGRTSNAKLFTYNKDTDTIGTIVNMNVGGNAPQPSPSGNLFLLNISGVAQVRDANLNLLRTLNISGSEHSTIGLADGVDTHLSVQFDVSPYGTLIATDMTNGNKRVIIGQQNGYPYPPSGTHISAVAYKNPGWASVSVVGSWSGVSLLSQEIVLANINSGGKVCRVAHHHSYGGDGPMGYWGEPHATISPSGTRILFASDWGGGSSVDTYVVELPSYVP